MKIENLENMEIAEVVVEGQHLRPEGEQDISRAVPVLKVDAHGAHVRRTKESWEDQKAG